MDIRDLEYFLTCCETGSFTVAARNAHIVQSAMSSAIARLERELRVPLFDRSVTPVALTEHGAALKAGAQRIVETVEAARDDVAAVFGQVRGTVTLPCTLNTGTLDLADVLARVRDRPRASSSNCASPHLVPRETCKRSATARWTSRCAPAAATGPSATPREESFSTICGASRWFSCRPDHRARRVRDDASPGVGHAGRAGGGPAGHRSRRLADQLEPVRGRRRAPTADCRHENSSCRAHPGQPVTVGRAARLITESCSLCDWLRY